MCGKITRFVCAILAVCMLTCAAACADDRGMFKFEGNIFRPALFGSSGGEWSELVLASLPFALPEEGEVILLRCEKLGSQITPHELSGVVAAFQLYNARTDRYLKPVCAITVPETSSTFDLLFYENTAVDPADYTLFCEGEHHSLAHMYDYRPETKVLRAPPAVLPTMPPEGEFLAEARPAYCEPAERLLRQSRNGELPVLDGAVRFSGKLAVVVFDSQDTVWKTTLDGTDPIRDLLPADRLAASLEEADTLILIHSRSVVVGQYGTHGSARRIDTLVTVIDPGQSAMYPAYTAVSSNPPASISTNALFAGGAEGNYEYEEAIRQIAQQLD